MRRSAYNKVSALTIGCLLWLLLATTNAGATVLQELSFDDLVAQSVFIFAGKVQSAREEQQGELVYTLVTFNVEQTFKGSAPTATIELRFIGGAANGHNVKVAGQFIPAAGARGVFFVESLDTKQINPLSGWQQGFFPLMQDASGADYLDMRQRPDLKIPGLEVDPLVGKMLAMGFSLEAIDAKVPRASLFSLDDFRAAIFDQLSRSQGAAQ